MKLESIDGILEQCVWCALLLCGVTIALSVAGLCVVVLFGAIKFLFS